MLCLRFPVKRTIGAVVGSTAVVSFLEMKSWISVTIRW